MINSISNLPYDILRVVAVLCVISFLFLAAAAICARLMIALGDADDQRT